MKCIKSLNRFFKLPLVFLFLFASVFFVFAEEGEEPETQDVQEKQEKSEESELDSILKSIEEDVSERKTSALPSISSLPHKFEGGINDLAIESNKNDSFYVAGEDGFVTRVGFPKFYSETWQLSTLPIKKIAPHPDGYTISVYESNGVGLHKISVWNWKEKKRAFIIRPNYLVTSLSWSANGSYLLVGNTENGIEVFDKQGKAVNIYSSPPGIVLLATTGKRERSIVAYCKNGKLNYTSLKNKKKLAEYKTIVDLKSPRVIKNYTRIVGFSEDAVLTLNAYTGEVLEKYKSRNAIFACTEESEEPIWIESDYKKNKFYLHIGNKTFPAFTYKAKKAVVSAAISVASHVVLAMSDGTLQVLKNEKEEPYLACLFEYKLNEKIRDITSSDTSLFLLKDNAVIKKDGIKNEEILIKEGLECNSILYAENHLILWSKAEKKPIYKYSLSTQKKSNFYKPKTNVVFCSIYEKTLLVLESSGLISIISIEDDGMLFSYVVEGAESALQRDEKHIIIAKNTFDATASPLLELNIETKEAVPIRLGGDLAFSLTKSKEFANKFFCFLLGENSERTTNLIQFATEENRVLTGRFEKLLTYEDEDFSAFILSTKDAILTNLGKNELIYFKLYEKKLFRLERSSALPQKACIFAGYIASLCMDGTLAYYNLGTLKLEK